MKKKKQESKKEHLIEDWCDFICISGGDFMLIILGVVLISELPTHVQGWFALSVLLTAAYFTKKQLYFLFYKIELYKNGK